MRARATEVAVGCALTRVSTGDRDHVHEKVPQFLLEEAGAAGLPARIIVTQPRRISAITVSERVAAERGEAVGKGTVGYQIRLETRGNASTPVMFCTNGVLLRKLTSDRGGCLAGVTHILVDEVHERDKFADFLLIVIRDILPSHPHLRVVLMSATLNESVFSEYFGGCPVVRVPGFTYPVERFFLEDALKRTGWTPPGQKQAQSQQLSGGASQGLKRVLAPELAAHLNAQSFRAAALLRAVRRRWRARASAPADRRQRADGALRQGPRPRGRRASRRWG